MKPSFVEKLKTRAPAVGTLITLDAPEVSELLSSCGFDWLFIDMEHGALTVSAAQRHIQAIRGDCSALVRVPENSAVWIKRVLDTGCDGIIVPMVNSADEARRAVAAAKYPPLGARSAGIARAHGYGLSFGEYVASANQRIAVIIQIEHIQAVNNLDEILQVSGIDAILIGPYDLSASMNRLGEVTSEPVQAAIGQVKEKSRSKSIPLGIFVLNPQAAQKEIQDGCQFIAVGTDTVFLANAAKDALSLIHPTSDV